MNIDPASQKIIDSLLRFVPSTIEQAIILTDSDSRILFMNPMAERLTGFREAEVYGRTVAETFRIYDEANGEPIDVRKRVETGRSSRSWDSISIVKADGRGLPVSGSVSPVTDEAGETGGFVVILHDAAGRMEMERQLEHMSMQDVLTDSYNRTWFEHGALRREIESHPPVGLIVCDVDGLKMINDTMGHEKGDGTLILAAGILKECTPAGGMVARIGGDEFVLVLPAATVQTTGDICRKIRQRIAEHNQMSLGLPLSISLGFAVSDRSCASVSGLFQEADSNMYREKLHNKRSVRSAIVHTILRMAEERDPATERYGTHSEKMMELLALSLGFPDDRIDDLRLLARFHDIGNVGIDEAIFLKAPETLTDEETVEVQRHCEIGHNIATSSQNLSHIANWILKHHEWWNGNGYPLGLKGENIPVECRMMSIVDAYNAMTHARPYRKAMSRQKALAELKKGTGLQFDPQMVFEFIRAVEALKVYVASSMHDAMLHIERDYTGDNPGKGLLFLFGSSGALMQRIEEGALADIFISAASSQMDELQAKDLIINDSRRNLLQNRIVLIASRKPGIDCGFPELVENRIEKIAIGDPGTVPAGKYAYEVLMSFGISEKVKPKLVFANDVRQVLKYVETGAIDVGMVYQTDVTMSDKVKILDWAPHMSHAPIVYPAATIRTTDKKEESEDFMRYLTTSDRSREIFERFGFILHPSPASPGPGVDPAVCPPMTPGEIKLYSRLNLRQGGRK